MDRRNFFKNISSITAGVLLAPIVFSTFGSNVLAEESRRKKPSTGPEMVDTKDQTAKALGYVENAKASPKSMGNRCGNCQLYTKTKDVNGGKEIGPCTLFPKKNVYAEAFCNSWTKKAV